MAITLGDEAPDFTAESTEGTLKLHDYLGDSWGVLFSHPKDFTPVCTTELGRVAQLKPEFDKRNVKVVGLSVDATTDHEAWAKDIEETQGTAPNYPIIGDSDFKVSKLYGMLPASTSGDPKQRTPADNMTVRNVYVIGPDKKVKMILTYPMTTGRNFDEILRGHRLAPAQRAVPGGDAGRLAPGRRRDHHRRRQRRRRQDEVPEGMEGAQALPADHASAGQVARPRQGARAGRGATTGTQPGRPGCR